MILTGSLPKNLDSFGRIDVLNDESPVPHLVLVNVPQAKWSFPILRERQIIGRGQKADIKTPSRFPNLSRRHAEIWRDEEGVWMRDLNSRAGTHVNSIWVKALNSIQIEADDRIWMGGLELEVVTSHSIAERQGKASGNDQDTTAWNDQFTTRKLLEELTPAELAVVYCLSRGKLLDEEIGLALGRSPHTVRTQFASIFQKLGLHSRGELLGLLKRTSAGQAG